VKKEKHNHWQHVEHQRGFVVFRDAETERCVREIFPGSFDTLLKDRSLDTYSRGATSVVDYGSDGSQARVRLYRRGGMLRHCNSMTFIGGLTESRLLLELEILHYLREQGIPVPRPLGGYVEYVIPGVLYRCAIAMEEVRDAKSLLELFHHDPCGRAEIRELSTHAAEIIERLIAAGVYHRDLHPGNVLRAPDNSLVLIDFDKALFVEEANRESLSAAYSSRWARGCRKHLDENKAREAIASFALRPKQYVSNA
jgi:serine/threonine protein kinase